MRRLLLTLAGLPLLAGCASNEYDRESAYRDRSDGQRARSDSGYARDTWDGPPEDPNAPKSAAGVNSDSTTQAYDPNQRILHNSPPDRDGRTQATIALGLTGWPAESRAAAEAMYAKHGMPDQRTDEVLCWKDRAPFTRIAVFRDAWEHNFPVAHRDVVEHVVLMRIPADKTDDLAAFDGSIHVMRTAGEVAARCDSEEMNVAALNLANEIVSGERTAGEARDELARVAREVSRGARPSLAQSLRFTPGSRASAYVDEPDRSAGAIEARRD